MLYESIGLVHLLVELKEKRLIIQKNSSMKYLKPILIGLTIIGAIILLVNWYLSSLFGGWENDWKEDKKNQILFANYDGGVTGITIEMLNNGTFRVGNGSSLGIDYKEGKFEIKKDTIIFDRDLIGGTKAVMRYDSIYQDTFIFLVNTRGKLNPETRYRVHENTDKTNILVSILKNSDLEEFRKVTTDNNNEDSLKTVKK